MSDKDFWARLYTLIREYRNNKISRALFELEWRRAQKGAET